MDRLPDEPPLRVRAALWSVARVLLIACLIVGAAEFAARSLMPPTRGWEVWNRVMAAKLQDLAARTARGEGPEVLVVGDSTAAFNVVPEVLGQELGWRVYNLGTPGNYARSFDVSMRQGVLPELPTPKLLIVSFASFGFDPAQRGQASSILSSPVARRVQGERVWGDVSWLVRVHHLLRLLRDPPPHRAIFQFDGYEPYPDALQRRRQQPRLGAMLRPPPRALRPLRPPAPVDASDQLVPLRNLFVWATERGIRLVMVSPPADERDALPTEIAALCAEFGFSHLDYTELAVPQQGGHMDYRGAWAYSRVLARDVRALLRATPP